MSISIIGKDGSTIATPANGLSVFTGDASNSPNGVGAIRMFSENDAGSITGIPRLKSPETSQDYRLRVGVDSLLFTETFQPALQNTSIWNYVTATMTATQLVGALQFGTTQGTAASHGAFYKTYQTFTLCGNSPLAVEFSGGIFTSQLTANEIFIAGLGIPAAAGTPPIDGSYFKLTSAGLIGEINYNGTVTQTGVLANTLTLNDIQKFSMIVGEESVEFWLNDILLGTISLPNANGQPFLSAALPVFMQRYCTGAVSNSASIRVTDITVTQMDWATNKPWGHTQAAAGNMSCQYPLGNVTAGPLIFATNNTLPTTALPTNTALTTNLPNLPSGAGLATLWNLAATDMLLMSYSNTAGSTINTPRQLVITGVHLSAAAATATWTAPAAGAHLLQWFLCVGNTTASLATTEASIAKAPRRIPLGMMSWSTGATPIGTMPDRGDIDIQFNTPLIVNAGEYVQLACRMLNGAATATGGLHFTIYCNGYFQ